MKVFFLSIESYINLVSNMGTFYVFPVVIRDMALPQNGLSKGKQEENAIRMANLNEDWPDWGDAEEKSDRDDGKPVQISIRPVDITSKLPTTSADDTEEPWDDFEDSDRKSVG